MKLENIQEIADLIHEETGNFVSFKQYDNDLTYLLLVRPPFIIRVLSALIPYFKRQVYKDVKRALDSANWDYKEEQDGIKITVDFVVIL